MRFYLFLKSQHSGHSGDLKIAKRSNQTSYSKHLNIFKRLDISPLLQQGHKKKVED